MDDKPQSSKGRGRAGYRGSGANADKRKSTSDSKQDDLVHNAAAAAAAVEEAPANKKLKSSSPPPTGTGIGRAVGNFFSSIPLLLPGSASRQPSMVTVSSTSGTSSPQSQRDSDDGDIIDLSAERSDPEDSTKPSGDDDSVICISDEDTKMSSSSSSSKSQTLRKQAVPARKSGGRSSERTAVDGPTRKSSRQRRSTVINVGGYAVLRDNNYVVRGGEYVHGAFDESASSARRKPPAKSGNKAKPSSRKPRVLSEAETKRAAHNDAVRERVSAKQHGRQAFLARHVDVLAPFIEPKVESSLRRFAEKKASGASKSGDDEEWVDMSMQPDMIQADMRDYQMIGLNWMAKLHSMNLGMILGDEMGLGKTLQTISLLCHIKEREEVTGPSLVICPLSVLYSWCDELTKWAPDLKYLRLHSSCVKEREAQRTAFVKQSTEYDVVVTTYEMAKNPALTSLWSRQHFNYLVLDEGHKIKNHETQIAEGVRHIHCENRLILTGTPLQNNLIELWALLNFLYPDVFTVSTPFGDAFDLGHNAIDKEKLHNAHDLLDIFMLRRMKTEVEKLMPPKIETKVICPLSTTQIFWYKALLMKDVNLLARVSEKMADGTEKPVIGQTNRSQLNNLVMQLRKCCIHPFLFDGAEVDIESTSCEELIAASGKLAVLDSLLRSLFKKGHRVVLFSQFTTVLDIIHDYCDLRGWNFCRFDGGTPRAKRNFTVNQFNAPDSDCFIFLMSTRSGGMGLNLQTADTCILFDSDWNPQPDLQAMARVHRIGQKKTVHVYRLVSGGTVEERVVERAAKKLYLDKMVNRGLDVAGDDKAEGLSASELLSSLQFGCNAIFGDASQNLLPTEKDISIITDRNRTENTSAGKLKGGVTQTAKDFDTTTELKSTQKFGGVDFKALRDEQNKKKVGKTPSNLRDVAVQWSQVLEDQKRERKSRLLMIKGNGSGYGSAYVPVLASNNYELEKGESSVFSRELEGREGNYGKKKQNRLIAGIDFDNQAFCQVCGDGGELICCPCCPVSLHVSCAGMSSAKEMMYCSHHRCSVCQKDRTSAGGLLFPCQSCPNSFCEDCLPKKGVRLLGRCDRLDKLGYDSTKNCAYIHCSEDCEKYAAVEFGWTPAKHTKQKCPAEIDVSYNFGKEIRDTTIGGTGEDHLEEGRRTRSGK